MGLMGQLLGALFGSGRNVVAETAEVFRINAEAQAQRGHDAQGAALAQMAGEFRVVRRSWFDRFMDALNRVPRPAMALGTLGLFVTAMVDPVWFAARMAGIALVPEPLWWLLGAIVSFYFGARHLSKGQDFQRDLAATMAAVPQVVQTVRNVEALRDVTPGDGPVEPAGFETPLNNPALADWRSGRG
ncbi:holin of 3TMs, for gene-transfer release [Antarctobacter heliothermus]|uniref:Holin of 3TMs, for gene-transfer release n=1 Tax=Antarctobacter heliothermus TaxID=74033 RepID=A0A222E5X7_9RHOB|nr:holin family protein [Antarctobacter heliothermus]ASP21408.1 holin of 3TMs, for gene-transfer release [Antarctobacter heliothermus]